MSVISLTFLGFVVAAALLHGLWRNPAWRAGIFLVANVLFVASFTTSPQALLPFALFLVWGYVALRATPFVAGRLLGTVFVLGTLLIFCWLKKYWFLSAVPFLAFPYLTLGLSYTFFRIMGMILDARNEPAIARVGPVAYFNFAMNFPTMTAGPIDRYQNFATPSEPITPSLVGQGLERIVLGVFKVLVLSALFSSWQTQGTGTVLSAAPDQRLFASLLSFGIYPIYLYWNFSGYTDIVLGVGNLFGKHYPENFNIPFSSFSFLEYWSRWHMSLSNWLRDYVYTPFVMAMMRRNQSRRLDPYLGVIGYFVTFFLIGIWHGSTIIFAIYGLLLGLGVSINKLYQIYAGNALGRKAYKQLAARTAYRFPARGLTYTWTAFCLICFWANDAQAAKIAQQMGVLRMVASFGCLFLIATVLVNAWEELFAALRRMAAAASQSPFMPYARAVVVGTLAFACLAYIMVMHEVNSDVIYGAF